MVIESHVRGPRWDWGLTAIAALALAVRLPHLTDRSLWYDESSSWQTSKFVFSDMARSVRLNVHLPLYYTMLKGWMAICGESVGSLRGFSIFFGLLTVIFMGMFANELYRASSIVDESEASQRWFARVVALLVALSPFQAFLSIEARMYSLGTMFASLGAWLLLRSLRDAANLRYWSLFAVSCVGLLYTHHYGLFTVVGWFLFLGLYAAWLTLRGNRSEARFVVFNASKIGAFVATVYLPGLILLQMQVHRVQQDYWIPPMTWRIFSGTFSQFLLPTYGFDLQTGGWVVFSIFVLACLIVAVHGRRGDALVLASSIEPLVFAAAISIIQPVWHHRYFVFAHLFLLTALVLSVWKLTRSLPSIRILIVTSVIMILFLANVKYWNYFDVTNKTGIKGVVETILIHNRDGEMIITFDHHQYFPLKFYAGDQVRVRLVTPDANSLFWGSHLIRPEDLIEPDQLRNELRKGIWFVGKDAEPWDYAVLSHVSSLEHYKIEFYHSLHRRVYVFHLRDTRG